MVFLTSTGFAHDLVGALKEQEVVGCQITVETASCTPKHKHTLALESEPPTLNLCCTTRVKEEERVRKMRTVIPLRADQTAADVCCQPLHGRRQLSAPSPPLCQTSSCSSNSAETTHYRQLTPTPPRQTSKGPPIRKRASGKSVRSTTLVFFVLLKCCAK